MTTSTSAPTIGPGTSTAPAAPAVFVDPSGRRHRLAGRAVLGTLLGVLGIVGLTVGSVATDAGAPVEWHPTATAHVTPVAR